MKAHFEKEPHFLADMTNTLLGTYKLPRDCNADEVGSCQYVLRSL